MEKSSTLEANRTNEEKTKNAKRGNMSNNEDDKVVISKVNVFKVGTIQELEANKSITFDIPESAEWKGRTTEIAILKVSLTYFWSRLNLIQINSTKIRYMPLIIDVLIRVDH